MHYTTIPPPSLLVFSCLSLPPPTIHTMKNENEAEGRGGLARQVCFKIKYVKVVPMINHASYKFSCTYIGPSYIAFISSLDSMLRCALGLFSFSFKIVMCGSNR
ncbi:hypothetical protein CPB83DRAFT_618900 [Crepidotus variabilis]|uniref:Uncharacterized protein n=1 Tax=Crepidotus variabilis TaxID=179855 RepID=A0A9P6JL17_9AGAR|nr:hypothetical protein CPB83DRAFT_618900 [Crepidotus variabilis]